MNILLIKDFTGTSAYLTTESEKSVNGVPVLQITSNEISQDFRAQDIIGTIPNISSAASLVKTWLSEPGRTEEERQAAELFLGELTRTDNKIYSISMKEKSVAKSIKLDDTSEPEGSHIKAI